MKSNLVGNFGFTLVELLVVIAIIGILSSVAVVNLNGVRIKAQLMSVEYDMSALRGAINSCYIDGKNLTARYSLPGCGGVCYCTINGSEALPVAGYPICEGSSTVWPDISENGFLYYPCEANQVLGSWEIFASNSNGETVCNQDGCVSASF